MGDVMETIRSWPWGWAWLTLWAIGFCRAGATYVIGRLIASGVISRRRTTREVEPQLRSVTATIERWGPVAVALCFLTVGTQTLVNLGAGMARMSTPRYLMGLVPGAAIWATVWLTIGLAAIASALALSGDRPWGWIVVAGVLAVGIWAWRRRSRRFE